MKKCWLCGKTVIITGASGGLGFAVSKLLIEKYSCTILAVGRNKEKMQNSKNSLGELKDKFIDFYFDVSSLSAWESFKKELISKNLSPDILINNAGFMLPFASFDKYEISEIEEIVKTNMMSIIYSVKTLKRLLDNSKTPAIVNISSAAGLCAVVGQSMYCATKFAVRGFTETIRQEYKKKYYVGGVYPGFIKTDILNRQSTTDKENKLINKLMMPVSKASKRIVKGIKKRKKSMVMGFDGRSMSIFGRLFPKLTPSIIRGVLKCSKLELFKDVFSD
jgi:short-subunit dehydrogenase